MSVAFLIYPAVALDDGLPLLPRPGGYISTQYLRGLHITKSPLLAEGVRDVHGVNVIPSSPTSVDVMASINFHEGGPVIRLERDGLVSVVASAGSDLDGLVLRAETDRSLVMGFGKRAPETFVFVQDFDRLLRKVVISGRYRNFAGEIFEFTPAGMAITPQGSFPYMVGADHISYRFDHIVDPHRHLFFKLLRSGCVIHLYALPDWQNGHGPTDGSTATLWQSLRAEDCDQGVMGQ